MVLVDIDYSDLKVLVVAAVAVVVVVVDLDDSSEVDRKVDSSLKGAL